MNARLPFSAGGREGVRRMAAYAELAEILAEKRRRILDVWIARTLSGYKSPTFFLQARDPFANPVGALIRDGLEQVFDLLLREAEDEAFVRPLDQVLRIRAVQAFSPSQAVVPFLELKWAAREELGELEPGPLARQLAEFECAAERVALTAFDLYCRCREELYRGRLKEVRSGRARFTDGGCPSRMLDADAPRRADERYEADSLAQPQVKE